TKIAFISVCARISVCAAWPTPASRAALSVGAARARRTKVRVWGMAGGSCGGSGEGAADGAVAGRAEMVLQVLLALVAEQRHHGLELRVLLAHAARGHEVRARARAAEQAVATGQPAHFADGLLAGDRERGVHQLRVPGEDARDETVGNALDVVGAHFAA